MARYIFTSNNIGDNMMEGLTVDNEDENLAKEFGYDDTEEIE